MGDAGGANVHGVTLTAGTPRRGCYELTRGGKSWRSAENAVVSRFYLGKPQFKRDSSNER